MRTYQNARAITIIPFAFNAVCTAELPQIIHRGDNLFFPRISSHSPPSYHLIINKLSNFKMKPKVYQFFVALFASFGSFLYGYDLGVIASVVASDSFVHKFLESDRSTKSGTVVALFTGGEFNSISEASS
jgi:Sugar (and other) transporter